MMDLYRLAQAHIPDPLPDLALKRGQLVDMQRQQPSTHWKGWHWVEEAGQSGWVPYLLLGKVDAERARVLEDYNSHELNLPATSLFVSLRCLAAWHYGYAQAQPQQFGWVPDANLHKPALQRAERPTGRVAALCSAPTGALPKFQESAAVFLVGLGMQGDYHCGPLQKYSYYRSIYPQPENWRQVLITDTAIYAHLKTLGLDLPYGSTNENIVLDGILTKLLQIGQRIRLGELLLEVSERRSPCVLLDAYQPGLKDALLSTIQGQKVRDGGVLARVLRGGTLYLGDAAQVLDPGEE